MPMNKLANVFSELASCLSLKVSPRFTCDVSYIRYIANAGPVKFTNVLGLTSQQDVNISANIMYVTANGVLPTGAHELTS